jgi:hypothetical protein
MKETLLDQYEAWKKRHTPWPNLDIKNRFIEGISIGGKLLQLGCHKDREGMDIQHAIDNLEEQLRKIEEMEPRE